VRPETLCGQLAEPERLRVYAAVVLGAATPGEVARRTGLNGREVVRALQRLEQGGLVETVDGRLRADPGVFKEAVRAYAPAALEPLDADQTRAAVLRSFTRDGRLVSIPVPRAKRRIVIEHVAALFQPGVKYAEPEVNALLRAVFDDYVTLRRYLIDEQLLDRDAGVYWRAGGYVDIA
jgi:hypothetical protein